MLSYLSLVFIHVVIFSQTQKAYRFCMKTTYYYGETFSWPSDLQICVPIFTIFNEIIYASKNVYLSQYS